VKKAQISNNNVNLYLLYLLMYKLTIQCKTITEENDSNCRHNSFKLPIQNFVDKF